MYVIRTIRFIMFLFYNYYRDGKWESAPYFHTLSSMSLLLFLQIAALLCWINKGDVLFGNNKGLFIIKAGIVLIIFMVGLRKFAPEKHLQILEYDQNKIKQGGWLLILYIILVIGLLMAGMIY